VDDVGVTGKDVLKVDIPDSEERLVFEAFALGVVRQWLVDGGPMLKDVAYCHGFAGFILRIIRIIRIGRIARILRIARIFTDCPDFADWTDFYG